jgi:hypothetical protein
VVSSDGHTYERAAIEQWFAKPKALQSYHQSHSNQSASLSLSHAKSPMTGERVTSLTLTPNFTLRSMIAEWVQQQQQQQQQPKNKS